MAVYIVHASLLLIFAGGIIDGLFGYSGFMVLQNGQTSNIIELRTGGKKQTSLRRQVQWRRTGKLTPTARPSGGGRSWPSCRTDRKSDAKEIVVNDPLVHQGCVSTRQASEPPANWTD